MTDPFARIAARLAERARALAAERALRRPGEDRWRDARLLWPHFGKD